MDDDDVGGVHYTEFLGGRLLFPARLALYEVVDMFLGTERFHHAGDRRLLLWYFEGQRDEGRLRHRLVVAYRALYGRL